MLVSKNLKWGGKNMRGKSVSRKGILIKKGGTNRKKISIRKRRENSIERAKIKCKKEILLARIKREQLITKRYNIQ